MRTRLSFIAICSLLLSLLTTTTPANSSTSNLEIFAVIDSKPGEVELTFISKIAAKSITSYQITAKPKAGTGLTFTNSYIKKASGYITQKISPLSIEVEYIFTITVTTTGRKVIKSAPFTHLVSSTVPSTPLITKVEATDADEAVISFQAPKDDGGTPIYYYTLTSNPGAVVITYPGQGSGSITIGGLTKATSYTFTLTAHNINGSSKAATSPAPITTLAEKIVRSSPAATTNAPTLAAPAFTLSSSSQSVLVNNAITTVTNTSTGGAISSYAISPAAPAGLTFSTSTGQLSGTPTSTQSATAYTISATNAAGSATATFTLTVTVGTPAFSLSSASETRVVTTAITGYTITSTGAPITSYSLVGTLPTGLSFSTSNGLITGTPTETRTATTYTIIGASASGETATATYRLRVTGDIGDTGPGGGIIYYYRAAGFNCGPTRASTCKYLEAAPSGWNTGSDPAISWATNINSNQTTAVPAGGAVLNGIGNGYKNSDEIVAQTGNVAASSAAVAARAYQGNGLTDWYLPTSDELQELYNKRTTVGGLGTDFYWSSRQTGTNLASVIRFSDNAGGSGDKSFALLVRPVRAF